VGRRDDAPGGTVNARWKSASAVGIASDSAVSFVGRGDFNLDDRVDDDDDHEELLGASVVFVNAANRAFVGHVR
jgi:hypothetical protein